jgi:hypothetical protein
MMPAVSGNSPKKEKTSLRVFILKEAGTAFASFTWQPS